MFGIKKSFGFAAVIVFIFIVIGLQTIPKMQYYSMIKHADLAKLVTLAKKYPDYPEAYIIIGEKYSSDNPEKAAYYYKKASEIVNNKKFSAAMDEYIAASYLKNGNALYASRYLSNPVLVKYNSTTNIMLANILRTSGRYNEAINVLDTFERNTFLAVASGEPDMFTRIRYEFFYNLLSSIDSGVNSNNYILHAKALVYCEKGDYDTALAMLNQYMKLSNHIPAALFLKIYTAKGDLKHAEKYYNMINKSKRDKNIYEKYSLGFYLMSVGEYNKAENIFNDLAHDNQKSKILKKQYGLYGLGLLNMKTGNYYQAISYFREVLELRPYSYETIVKLMECYKKTNDIKNYNRYNMKIKALLTY